jgi:hypothetical protein
LLQRIARHTMHELVRCIFSHLLICLPDINMEHALANGSGSSVRKEVIILGTSFLLDVMFPAVLTVKDASSIIIIAMWCIVII